MISVGLYKNKFLSPLFLLTVVVPTSLSLIYFGALASDVFISESKFVVRSPDKPAQSGLGLLLKTSGFANAGDEIYAAQNFVLSRDALKAVNQNDAFARAYGNSSISVFDKFNPSSSQYSFEELFKYYKKKVEISHDATSSITTLTVKAYSSEDAYRFNERLLEMAEATVNKLSRRGRADLIRFAEIEVTDAKKKAQEAALALSVYRNKQGVIDPEKQAAVQLQMVSKIQDELITTRTQLLQLKAFAPRNPQIPVLETRARGLAKEMDTELRQVAGSSTSLSSQAAQYQRLVLDNQFAERQLASALGSYAEARNEARRKQAYVERIVEPNTPDEALEPRRIRGVFSTLLVGLVAWGILSMLIAGMMEHKD